MTVSSTPVFIGGGHKSPVCAAYIAEAAGADLG